MMAQAMQTMPSDWSELQKQDYLTGFYNKNFCHAELQKDTKIIYIPFTSIEKAYTSTNLLMADLVAFSKGNNNDLVKNTSKCGFLQKKISTSIGLNLGIVAINFNFD